MTLSRYHASASIAVSDMTRAREFYEGKLGLATARDQPDGGWACACGGGTWLYVYPSPVHVGKATTTLAKWDVDDLEQAVDELRSNGVTFEQFDEPGMKTDERGSSAPRTARSPGSGILTAIPSPSGSRPAHHAAQ